jgi:hypothetical protein
MIYLIVKDDYIFLIRLVYWQFVFIDVRSSLIFFKELNVIPFLLVELHSFEVWIGTKYFTFIAIALFLKMMSVFCYLYKIFLNVIFSDFNCLILDDFVGNMMSVMTNV